MTASADGPELVRRLVVRGFGYEVRHLVEVPPDLVASYTWAGKPFYGVELPLVALCGARVRSVQATAVVMDAPASCRHCLRFAEYWARVD